jgi:hypothetical protein
MRPLRGVVEKAGHTLVILLESGQRIKATNTLNRVVGEEVFVSFDKTQNKIKEVITFCTEVDELAMPDPDPYKSEGIDYHEDEDLGNLGLGALLLEDDGFEDQHVYVGFSEGIITGVCVVAAAHG